VALHDVLSVDRAYNKVMKIEGLQNRALPFKSAVERTFSSTSTQQDSTSSERPPARKAIDAPPVNPAISAALPAKGKENPYARLDVGKC